MNDAAAISPTSSQTQHIPPTATTGTTATAANSTAGCISNKIPAAGITCGRPEEEGKEEVTAHVLLHQTPTLTTTAATAIAATVTTTKNGLTMDAAACTGYLCTILVLSLPVILVPLAVIDHTVAIDAANPGSLVAAHVARISSLAAVGGAMGKFINGFVCQEMGTYACSKWYLIGLALSSFVLSLSSSPLGIGAAVAGLEFFASVQCASFAIMISDYYKGNAAKLAAGLTALGLASTIGEVMAKVLGTALTSTLHWRHVAQLGSFVAIAGAFVVTKAPGQVEAAQQKITKKQQQQQLNQNPILLRWSSIVESLKAVLGSMLFWKLSLAYSMAFVACSTDRILGPFYNSLTHLPFSICGGLTLSITLGLVHGLVTGSKETAKLSSSEDLQRFTKHRYVKSVAATMGLAVLAKAGPIFIPNGKVMASLVALLSATMASNVVFQCYQFPAMIAQAKFADHQAVCISFLDCVGYLLSVPLFAALGAIVPHPQGGWFSGWAMLSVLFGAGAVVMTKTIPPILKLNWDK